MKKTIELQPLERHVFIEPERDLKHRFYVLLFCSLVCQSCIWYVLLTDNSLSKEAYWSLFAASLIALACLFGLGYCYYGVRKARLHYERFLQEQKEEMNSLVEELQAKISKLQSEKKETPPI